MQETVLAFSCNEFGKLLIDLACLLSSLEAKAKKKVLAKIFIFQLVNSNQCYTTFVSLFDSAVKFKHISLFMNSYRGNEAIGAKCKLKNDYSSVCCVVYKHGRKLASITLLRPAQTTTKTVTSSFRDCFPSTVEQAFCCEKCCSMNIHKILFLTTVLYGLCNCQNTSSATTVTPGDSDENIRLSAEVGIPSLQRLINQIQELIPENLLDRIPTSEIRSVLNAVYNQLQNLQSGGNSIVRSLIFRLQVLITYLRDGIESLVHTIDGFIPRGRLQISVGRQRRSLITAPINWMRNFLNLIIELIQRSALAAQNLL
ncbi:uncharacterized protein LOC143183418 [Calliopsis andreniformis]|uniref:uncharacterized protein LOC143183418 n=1 Tax=Calliopsis andreniformis TaxID=337506 RepID=UPI003FCDE661